MIDLTKEEIELIKSMVAKESFALGQALTTVNSVETMKRFEIIQSLTAKLG